MQSFLGRSRWDDDALCDEVRAYVFYALGDPDGVLVADGTAFLKDRELPGGRVACLY
jgi:SRSO17 transposase